jgi:hypothetical protein
MMTHRQTMLMAMRGEMPESLPYVPRIDLWYNANSAAGTLPGKYRGKTQDEICRAEGWALHKIVPEFLNVRGPEDNLHRALGIYALKEMAFGYRFSPDIQIEARREGHSIHVTYHTPVGTVSTTTAYTEEMRKAGASITWIEDHVLKVPEDYKVVGYLFENLDLIRDSGMHVAEAICPHPMTKARVGNPFAYAEGNFLADRSFTDWQDLNQSRHGGTGVKRSPIPIPSAVWA